ncbi:hypothetical protein RHMOL_Rhmol10G0135400 [Rhododendron molle]|uniref:Uncharacterized protein n=1 Tax=Rhododendron molle TaxID=49168 RepID=A0ACC0M249_RHOML|nr:hypothetical protein RHMOL_Rhmol10G0135400 [Rhododendron molle]
MAMDSSQQGATAIPLCQDQPPSELLEDSTENLPESSPTRMEDDGREEDVKENEDLSKRYLPCVQMEFESEQEAYDFYNEYARISGFCVRRHWRTLSKIDGILIARMFVCNKEGQKEIDKRSLVVEQPHKETRSNCLASMYVSLNRNTSKWVVKKFEENHNHVLHLPEHSHLLKSHRMWDTIVLEKRYEESKAIFNSREKFQRTKLKESPILIQVSQVYSPPLFDLFHNEVDASLRCVVKPCLEFGGQFNFFISKYREKVKYVVKGSVETDEFGETICRDICCSCRKFESFGILCCHALSGLHRMGVFEIPERYLLGRWRLDAKDCGLEKEKTGVDENDPKLQKAARFRIICPKMVKLATRSCEVQEAYEFVEETVEYMCAKVANILLGSEEEGCTDAESEELEKVDPQFARVKGLKKKSGLKIKGTRRLKPWHERGRKRKKVASQSTTRLSEHIDHAATTTIVHGSFMKQQPDVYIPQMVSYEDGSQSIASSSQASHNPQTLKEMSFDPTSHSSWGGNNFMDNQAFLEMLSYSGCPQKNLK